MTLACLLLAAIPIWDCPIRYPPSSVPPPRSADEAPRTTVEATLDFGRTVVLGEQNLEWDFAVGAFVAKLKLPMTLKGGNAGDLYVNRDSRHSAISLNPFPGLVEVRLDEDGRRHRADRSLPNMFFPRPVFGNASLAMTQGPAWRSLSRALLTTERRQLPKMMRFYLSNQIWVFPSNADTPPIGTNGDVFASIAPYWLTTAGRSWSDLPYLSAALVASGAMAPEVKDEVVRRGLLSPTIQTLLRKTLRGIADESDYLSPKAHPTALPPGGADTNRIAAAARALTVEAIPPLVTVNVETAPCAGAPTAPELLYGTAFAWAYVIRTDDAQRSFYVSAKGATEFAFVKTHGDGVETTIRRISSSIAKVTVDCRALSPTCRVDIAVFGRNPRTGWGAPSYVSFARMDAAAPYSDPALTIRQPPPKAP